MTTPVIARVREAERPTLYVWVDPKPYMQDCHDVTVAHSTPIPPNGCDVWLQVAIPGTVESARATAIAAAKDAVVQVAESHIGCDGDSETFAQLAKAVRDLQALATLAAAEGEGTK